MSLSHSFLFGFVCLGVFWLMIKGSDDDYSPAMIISWNAASGNIIDIHLRTLNLIDDFDLYLLDNQFWISFHQVIPCSHQQIIQVEVNQRGRPLWRTALLICRFLGHLQPSWTSLGPCVWALLSIHAFQLFTLSTSCDWSHSPRTNGRVPAAYFVALVFCVVWDSFILSENQWKQSVLRESTPLALGSRRHARMEMK